jgi:Peptidase family S41
MINRRHFLSAGALAGAACTFPAALSAAPAKTEDIRLLGEILRAIHPGLHRYLSPAAFEAGLARLDRQWQAAPSLEVRFVNLTRFLAAIRCGHSYPSFYNQKRSVADQLFTKANRVPFAFRWIDRAMVVTQDQSGQAALPAGTVVTAINGVSTRSILSRVLPLVRADGSNDGKRSALLSVSGADGIETFDVLFGLLFPASPESGFAIDYHLPGTETRRQAALKPIDLAARKAFQNAPDPRGDQPIWQWTMSAEGIATLTMPGWALYNSKWDWQTWLSDRLDSLAGARGLIVDLRENEGGNDCGDAILARLASQDIVPPKVDRLVRYRQIPAALNPYLDTWDDSFRDWGTQVQPFNDRFMRLTRWEQDSVIAAKRPRITVPMAVLTSPQNSSATFQFASLVKATGLGTLIGETTGGNRRGINGGAFFFVRLPESGIEFDLPLIGYYPHTREPDAGQVPDIIAAQTAADLASGRDPAMQSALAWLRSRA